MKKLSNEQIRKLDRPGTIGQIERLAGIEDREEFWKKHYKPGVDCIPEGMKELRKLAAKRVLKGEMSLV